MAHTYVQNLVHVVFSTKERRKLISKEAQARLWGYITGVCKRERIFVREIGGMEERPHVDSASADIVSVRRNSRNQDKFFPLDGTQFCLAARIWSV
jgi:hypothetical protein